MELNSLWANRSAVVKPSFAKLLAMRKIFLCLFLLSLLAACGQSWNDPYPVADGGRNILYTAFTDRPKHLDPAQSYTCLLYTSDAADERSSVDLGGRRIIKKKTKKKLGEHKHDSINDRIHTLFTASKLTEYTYARHSA